MQPDEELFLTSAQVRHRYGDRSQMWIYRKLNDPTSRFPRPQRFDGRLRFWPLSKLIEYDRACAISSDQPAPIKNQSSRTEAIEAEDRGTTPSARKRKNTMRKT